ncbi:MAG: hypothetical protein ABMA26_16150 [Limisphaerales bacterium]
MKIFLTANPQNVTVAAGGQVPVDVSADYVRFDTLPTGLLVSVNDGTPAALAQGIILQGEPGEFGLNKLRFVNTTGGALDAVITTGTGRMTVAGVATLSGSVPLPSGASTAALQTTGNTSLASILSGLAALATNALQTAANALLTTIAGLAATTVEVPELRTMGASEQLVFTGCRSIAILNTNTGAVNVTVTTPGGARTLAPGQSVGWAVTKHLATLSAVTVDTAASGSAQISTTT